MNTFSRNWRVPEHRTAFHKRCLKSASDILHGSARAINFPVLLGTDEITRQLGYEGGVPASVLVLCDAKEVKIVRGPFNEQAVSKAIKRLL